MYSGDFRLTTTTTGYFYLVWDGSEWKLRHSNDSSTVEVKEDDPIKAYERAMKVIE